MGEPEPVPRYVQGAKFLIIRAGPTVKSSMIGFLPAGTLVAVSPTAVEERIGDLQGHWNHLPAVDGYVFGHFLGEAAPARHPVLELTAYSGDNAGGGKTTLRFEKNRVEMTEGTWIHCCSQPPPGKKTIGSYRYEPGMLVLDFDGRLSYLKWHPTLGGYYWKSPDGSGSLEGFKKNGQILELAGRELRWKVDGCGLHGYDPNNPDPDPHYADYSIGFFCLR